VSGVGGSLHSAPGSFVECQIADYARVDMMMRLFIRQDGPGHGCVLASKVIGDLDTTAISGH